MPRHHSAALRLEPLEGRDAPATLLSPYKVTYQDADGDAVAVTLSKPLLSAANANTVFAFNTGTVNGDNAVKQQLRQIDLVSLGAAAAGVAARVAATRSPVRGGDGRAAVGQIDSQGLDLGVVTIDGDLGRIVAGSSTTPAAGLAGLAVHSLGRYGTGTGAAGLVTSVLGRLGFLRVATDVKEAAVSVFGSGAGLGAVSVGGSLIGGAGINSGVILAAGPTGPVRIGGDVVGGTGVDSGKVDINSRLAGVTIGGSVRGGPGDSSGRIDANGALGPVLVRGDLVGGTGVGSGNIGSSISLAGVTVGGSVRGGPGSFSGRITTNGPAGPIAVGRDLVGGSASGFADLTASGLIEAKRIARLTLGGSLVAGTDATLGVFSDNGAVRAADDIGAVLIRGSIVGNAGNPAEISARGRAVPTATGDLAIGRLTVRGRVEYALIRGGVTKAGVGVNADAQIGSVVVGGDWIASSLAAGAVDGGNGFGNSLDARMSGAGVKDDPLVVSKVASLTVGGQVLGTTAAGDHFGVVAEVVGPVTVGGTLIPTAAGKSNDNFPLGITGDFRVNEV